MRHTRSALLLALPLALGCPPTDGSPEPEPMADCEERVDLAPDVADVVAGNSDFAWDLYQTLREAEDGNVFVSPLSISAAFGMTLAGARGETAEEMREVLGLTLDDATWSYAFGDLLRDLDLGPGCDTSLALANRLWGQADYPFLADFLALTEQAWDAPFGEVDFIGDTEGARQTINAWVEDKTQEKIQELIPAGVLKDTSRLVLTNAIYFKADWASAFDPSRTADASFRLADGGSVTAPLMWQEGSFPHLYEDDLQVLKLPYTSDQSMILLLPHADDGLAAVEDRLDAEQVEAWIAALYEAELEVSLPRFTTTLDLRLEDAMKAMGMERAFEFGVAEFEGIADPAQTGEMLYIQAALHKAFIAVDEAGTEAAAATAVVVGTESAGPVFRADHPFAFLIRDDVTGSILFMGRVMDPTDEGA